jgi:hypothetical protein
MRIVAFNSVRFYIRENGCYMHLCYNATQLYIFRRWRQYVAPERRLTCTRRTSTAVGLDYNYCKKNIYWNVRRSIGLIFYLAYESYKEGVIKMGRTEITSEYVDWIALRSD